MLSTNYYDRALETDSQRYLREVPYRHPQAITKSTSELQSLSWYDQTFGKHSDGTRFVENTKRSPEHDPKYDRKPHNHQRQVSTSQSNRIRRSLAFQQPDYLTKGSSGLVMDQAVLNIEHLRGNLECQKHASRNPIANIFPTPNQAFTIAATLERKATRPLPTSYIEPTNPHFTYTSQISAQAQHIKEFGPTKVVIGTSQPLPPIFKREQTKTFHRFQPFE